MNDAATQGRDWHNSPTSCHPPSKENAMNTQDFTPTTAIQAIRDAITIDTYEEFTNLGNTLADRFLFASYSEFTVAGAYCKNITIYTDNQAGEVNLMAVNDNGKFIIQGDVTSYFGGEFSRRKFALPTVSDRIAITGVSYFDLLC